MKRIILRIVPGHRVWRADSTRYRLSAYGRSITEARSRLFLTVRVHRRNCDAVVMGQLGLPIDIRPRVR